MLQRQVEPEEEEQPPVYDVEATRDAGKLEPVESEGEDPGWKEEEEEGEWPPVYDVEPTRDASELDPVESEGQESEWEEEEEEEIPIQAKLTGGQTPWVSPGLAAKIRSLRGSGRPLSQAERDFFEPRFGYDFGQVRVHTDGKAAGLAKSVNAQAFTIGQNIVFGNAEYASRTQEGQRLLAHELTHTLQQGRNMPQVIRRKATDEPPQYAVSGKHTGWQVDTTCLYYGILPNPKNYNCIDYWPPHVERHAIARGYDGVASCNRSKLQGRLAYSEGGGKHVVLPVGVWHWDIKERKWKHVTVICADTTSNLVELSPAAATKLFGSHAEGYNKPIRAAISIFGGLVLYYHYKQPPRAHWLPYGPTLRQCLSKGCGSSVKDQGSPWSAVPQSQQLRGPKWLKTVQRHRKAWAEQIEAKIIARRVNGAFSRDDLKEILALLRAGQLGKAIRKYQSAEGLLVTGQIDPKTSRKLGFVTEVPWWVSGNTVGIRESKALASKREKLWIKYIKKKIEESMRFAKVRNRAQWLDSLNWMSKRDRKKALKAYQRVKPDLEETGFLDDKTRKSLGVPELPWFVLN